MSKIYDNVAKRAKEKQLPIYVLEKKANIGNGVIRGWKTTGATVETLRKVAAVLDCTIDDLIE